MGESRIGQRFGRWTVLRDGNTRAFWTVRCDCGTESHVEGGQLLYGRSTQCRTCASRKAASSGGRAKLKDMTGQVFGEWTVLHLSHIDDKHMAHWMCQCACGETKAVSGSNLRRGQSKRCRSCAVRKARTTE